MIRKLFPAEDVKAGLDPASRVPLYRQVADFLRTRIASGALGAGARLSPEYELAACFGVSLRTTREAMGLLVKEGLLYRRPRLGTVVRPRAAPDRAFGSVAMVLCRTALPSQYAAQLLSGVEERCRRLGVALILRRFRGAPETLAASVRPPCDGVLLAGYVRAGDCRWLASRSVPFVVCGLLSEEWEGAEAPHQVIVRPEHAARIAAEHLIRLGHRRLALVGGYPALPYYRRIRDGFLHTLRRHGLDGSRSVFAAAGVQAAPVRPREGGRLADRALRVRPTALVCADPLLAFGVNKRLHELGLRVPADVSLVALGNVPVCEFMNPGLTSVDADVPGFGQEAVAFLAAVVRGRAKERRRVWTRMRLVERDSVQPPAAPAPGRA